MPFYSKKNAAKLKRIQRDLEVKEHALAQYEAQLEAILAGEAGDARAVDLQIVKARKEVRRLDTKLAVFACTHSVDPRLAAAAEKPAPAKSHLFKPSRKDSHGYE